MGIQTALIKIWTQAINSISHNYHAKHNNINPLISHFINRINERLKNLEETINARDKFYNYYHSVSTSDIDTLSVGLRIWLYHPFSHKKKKKKKKKKKSWVWHQDSERDFRSGEYGASFHCHYSQVHWPGVIVPISVLWVK